MQSITFNLVNRANLIVDLAFAKYDAEGVAFYCINNTSIANLCIFHYCQ